MTEISPQRKRLIELQQENARLRLSQVLATDREAERLEIDRLEGENARLRAMGFGKQP